MYEFEDRQYKVEIVGQNTPPTLYDPGDQEEMFITDVETGEDIEYDSYIFNEVAQLFWENDADQKLESDLQRKYAYN